MTLRVRVLITNGVRTIDLFWLEHDGQDVYCGRTRIAEKRSYHASGKIHSKRDGRVEDEACHTPLKDLKGQYQLRSINIPHIRRFVQAAAAKYEYSGRKSDVVLTVDARTVPANADTCISIGLLEPRNPKAMMFLLSLAVPFPGEELLPRQLILSTAFEPWVYASIYWWMKGAS